MRNQFHIDCTWRGYRKYELKIHASAQLSGCLGSVLAVVHGPKLFVDSDNDVIRSIDLESLERAFAISDKVADGKTHSDNVIVLGLKVSIQQFRQIDQNVKDHIDQ